MYTALSRVTSISGLFLIGKYSKSPITNDKKVKLEYQYLRENQKIFFSQNPFDNCKGNIINFTLCNVRSLKKHLIDLRLDKAFISSNLILCTETQVTTDYNWNNLSLDNFSSIFSNNQYKYSSLAIYSFY